MARSMKNVRIIITARALIFNEKNELLLVKNEINQPWFAPGGWLDGFEKLEETCVREIYEETGLTIKPLKLFKIDYYQLTAEQNIKWKENVNKIEHYFICKIVEGKIMQDDNFANKWIDEDVGNTGFINFFSQESLQKEEVSPQWIKFIHKDL